MTIGTRTRAHALCAALTALTLLFFAAGACAKGQAAPAEKTTLDNLLAAYNGESNAHARYLAFAAKADEEGFGQAASLFRAVARAEQVHYERHAEVIRKLGGTPEAKIETPSVKTTKENLEEAVKGETYETEVMYPAFLAQAKKEKKADAVDAFEDAKAAEAVHAGWYKKVLANLDGWKGAKKEFSVCPVCGNVVDVLPGPACPICLTDTKKFIPVR
ncbi:MAG: ferritin family protein [Chlamydiota bacterium]